MCNEIIKPATKAKRCAYIDLLMAGAVPEVGGAADVGDSTDFISHAWKYNFKMLVSALEAARLPADGFLWVDCVVVNQHVNNCLLYTSPSPRD